ncbi:MAG: hypothetical protein M1276_00570 [Deltaproteobacteria bacterium]|nr:hypothetical protein [Deltaproteobacteria bacterium]
MDRILKYIEFINFVLIGFYLLGLFMNNQFLMTLLVPVVLALLQFGITQIRTNAKKESELKALFDKEKERIKEELKA